MAKKNESVQVEVMEVQKGEIRFLVKGTEPLIINRLSEKARRELLLPRGKKTAADKASTLKHNPLEEFRDAPHYLPPNNPTLLAAPSFWFKGALMSTAVDVEGLTKAGIGRQVYVPGEYVAIYGIPYMYIRPVRSADMNRTPDIRTRCIVPEWCCEVRVQYAKPILREKPIINLFAAAGIMNGVGDNRPQKGNGVNGQFEIVGSDDKDFKRIQKDGGRSSQIAAIQAAEPYDDETSELLTWFTGEAHDRGWMFNEAGEAIPQDEGTPAKSNGSAKKKSTKKARA